MLLYERRFCLILWPGFLQFNSYPEVDLDCRAHHLDMSLSSRACSASLCLPLHSKCVLLDMCYIGDEKPLTTSLSLIAALVTAGF